MQSISRWDGSGQAESVRISVHGTMPTHLTSNIFAPGQDCILNNHGLVHHSDGRSWVAPVERRALNAPDLSPSRAFQWIWNLGNCAKRSAASETYAHRHYRNAGSNDAHWRRPLAQKCGEDWRSQRSGRSAGCMVLDYQSTCRTRFPRSGCYRR